MASGTRFPQFSGQNPPHIALMSPGPDSVTPETDPRTPGTESVTPETEPGTPETEPGTPETEPGTSDTESRTPGIAAVFVAAVLEKLVQSSWLLYIERDWSYIENMTTRCSYINSSAEKHHLFESPMKIIAGIVLGIIFGVALHQLAAGIAAGVALGLVAQAVSSKRAKRDKPSKPPP